MARWIRFIEFVGSLRIITGIGALFVFLAALRSFLFWQAGNPLLYTLDAFVITSAAGIGLLYGTHWLTTTEIPSDRYPRIAGWTLGGLEGALVVFGLLAINPAGGISQPFFLPLVGTGLGSISGFAVGVFEARAITRSRESAAHRDRFRSERELRERIVETSAVGIVVVNADRSIRMVNERAAEIVGRPREALLEDDYDALLGTSRQADGAVVWRVLSSGEAVYDEERRLTSPDGESRWLLLNATPLRDASGDVAAVVLTYEDITERKQLEAELQETVRRLENSNERLEQFAHAASHDLQEPLRMITNFLELLEERHQDELDAEAQEFIDYAVDGAERMRAMIQSLLEYSRISTRGAPIEPTEVGAVLEDVRRDLTPRIEETDATVTVGDLPTVPADEDQLAQVFRNLVSNALTYSGDRPPVVDVTAERMDGDWRFAVADRGPGIDPDDHERIFELFESVHTAEEGSGSGLGLALCQRIVERHGGSIWVESDGEAGTTFCFTIPTKSSDVRESPDTLEPAGGS